MRTRASRLQPRVHGRAWGACSRLRRRELTEEGLKKYGSRQKRQDILWTVANHDPENQDMLLHEYVREATELHEAVVPFFHQAYCLAVAHKSLGNHSKAESLLRDLVKEAPDNVLVLRTLGILLFEEGRFGEAADVLKSINFKEDADEHLTGLEESGHKV